MFKDKLKELRKKNKINQSEMAKIFNISQSTISRLESGEIAATEDIILIASDYFDVSTDYLLGKTDIKNVYLYVKK